MTARSRSPRLISRQALLGAVVMLSAVFASQARAEENFSGEDWRGDITDARPAGDEAGPVYSSNDHWVGPVVIAMLGLFLAAAVAGPIVRAELPDTVPQAMSHEEDPAADR
jgi:hypothetical protein